MKTVDRDGIARTYELIRPHIRRTPVLDVDPGDFGLKAGNLTLKLELFQHTGSFKTRGAFTSLLTRDVPAAGVVAASGGNHGAAVAFAAMKLGIRATIFVPTVSSPAKMERIRGYGAELVVTGDRYDDALRASVEWTEKSGAMPVHAYDQPETCPTLARAMEAGRPVDAPAGGIAADSLAPRQVGQLMFPIAQQYVERVALVEDEAIAAAQQALWDKVRVMAEPGGAAALAALLSGAYRPSADERVGVLVCGGNVAR